MAGWGGGGGCSVSSGVGPPSSVAVPGSLRSPGPAARARPSPSRSRRSAVVRAARPVQVPQLRPGGRRPGRARSGCLLPLSGAAVRAWLRGRPGRARRCALAGLLGGRQAARSAVGTGVRRVDVRVRALRSLVPVLTWENVQWLRGGTAGGTRCAARPGARGRRRGAAVVRAPSCLVAAVRAGVVFSVGRVSAVAVGG